MYIARIEAGGSFGPWKTADEAAAWALKNIRGNTTRRWYIEYLSPPVVESPEHIDRSGLAKPS